MLTFCTIKISCICRNLKTTNGNDNMKKIILTIATATLMTVGHVQAAVLDFSSIVAGNAATPLYVPGSEGVGATIMSETGSVLVGASAAGQNDGFCFTTDPTTSCEFGGSMMFDMAVSNLMFDIDGASVTSDSVTITAFLEGMMVGSGIFANGNETLDFSAFGALDTLVFEDNSTAAGVGYSTFVFDSMPAPVHAPTSLAILGLGLAWLASTRRKAS